MRRSGRMRVVDLIEELLQFEPDTLVLVSGYEMGYESGIEVSKKSVTEYEMAYGGNYEEYSDFSADEGRVQVDAVVIACDSFRREI